LTGLELDELWSYVFSKRNKQWVWVALDAETKQVIALYIGDRSHESAQKLLEKIPDKLKQNAVYFTDNYEAYSSVLPSERHEAGGKENGHTNHVERFNCTLRQRCSRLVRKTLSFSKKLWNHIKAIQYFIFHYNQERYAQYRMSQEYIIYINPEDNCLALPT
jgi:IS1 family transposase